MPIDKKELAKRFTYHPPQASQVERYNELRRRARLLAKWMVEHTPESREQSLAITNLEEAVMWANAAIARNEPHVDPSTEGSTG